MNLELKLKSGVLLFPLLCTLGCGSLYSSQPSALPETLPERISQESSLLEDPVSVPTEQSKLTSSDDASLAGLISAGVGMGLADFFLNTTFHEGSHALATYLLGGSINSFNPYPHECDGNVVLGSVSYSNNNNFNQGEKALINIAPKITSLFLLLTYTSLREGGALPENKYAQLALWVLAMGAEVDFLHDEFANVISDQPNNDLVKFANNLAPEGHYNDYNLATRAVILALGTVFAYELYQGAERIFSSVPEEKSYGEVVVGPGSIGYKVEF